MDVDQSQDSQRSTTHATQARRGIVASIIIFLSSFTTFCFFLANFGLNDDDSLYFAIGMSITLVFIWPACLIGWKARNRRTRWVRAFMIMSIVSALFAVAQIGWITYYLAGCLANVAFTPCTDRSKACSSLSIISSFVTFVASIKASCITCDGVCSCCNIPMPPVPVLSDNATAYRVFENEQEPQIDVAPDVDGLYTKWDIEKAEPRREQFDPEENYVLHMSVYKGLVLIINNDRFPEGKNRPGSEVDLNNIQHVFRQIGYEPVIEENLSASGILSFLDSAISRINLEGSICHSSVVLVLMSHGEKRGILGTDSGVVTIQEMKSKFSGRQCPALLGKPKIFFIQACRGQMRTKSALDTDNLRRLQPNALQDHSDIDSCSSSRPISDAIETDGDVPDNADIYVANATSEGYFSIRDRVSGSWFIQTLCEELIARVHIDDLDTIMNKVTRRVIGFTGSVTDAEGKKKKILQTPDISKQGIGKKIYFMPKYAALPDGASSPTTQQEDQSS